MKKLSKITESIWSDMQDRSSGDKIRQEDKFNPDYVDFGDDTTVYWAIDNLEIDGEGKFYFDDIKDYNNNGWRLPTVDEVNQLKWNIWISWNKGCNHLKFDDGNELKLKTNGSGGFHMWTKEINTKFPNAAYAYGFDNSHDFDITSFNKSINRLFVFLVKDKKITESIWSDIQDRSAGDTIRKEDEIGNIRELKSVDMGGTVFWADKDLCCYDEYHFGYSEVFEYINKSEWRLPTLKEVEELDEYKVTTYDNSFVISGPNEDLIFIARGLVYSDKVKVITDDDFYYAWTSDLYNNHQAHILTFDDDKLIHSKIDSKDIMDQITNDISGKLCVRLVKDK